MIITEENYLAHYGILRKSGRYPWGSGENPAERSRGFLSTVSDLKKQGLSDSEIMKSFEMNSTQYRATKSRANNEVKQDNISTAERLRGSGMSNVAIGKQMGIPESSVRALLSPGAKDRADVLRATTGQIKDAIEKHKYVDVGSGVESQMGISDTKKKVAIAALQEEGYKLHYLKVKQLGTGKDTTLKVLTKGDVTGKEVYANREHIQQITSFSNDGGRNYFSPQFPMSIDSKRVGVRYKEDGGATADGVIFVRPGVHDVNLGAARYAQVRIAVNGTHYLKGMAIYKKDLPEGVDLLFNTNKSNTGNKLDALKPLKADLDGNIDRELPFGSIIKRQLMIKDENGNDHLTSTMNIVNEEGDWEKWKKTISSQVLSKQSPMLAERQLGLTYAQRKDELDEILSLTNPVVRKKLLESYADGTDAAAVHLKARALPNTASHVILPIDSLKETEIYAPNYKNGERVALIRYPHGGRFEIPELIVNNNNKEGKEVLGPNARDAVGIHHKVAARLSGADFDGDTVLVIPNNQGRIKSESPIQSLKGFDPQHEYPGYEGMPKLKPQRKQQLMGDISNLITDMTILGANNQELARAVRHSMVVIDAEKHNLNYRQSAIDNGIPSLKEKYQGKSNAGAATLISRSGKSTTTIEARRQARVAEGGPIDKHTGKKVFVNTEETFVNKDGKLEKRMVRVSRLGNVDDAHSLVSDIRTPIEVVYANHSNRLKALANEARRAMVNTPNLQQSVSAKKVYAKEVVTLNAKLNTALKNAPLERKAQLVATALVAAKVKAYPDMDPADLKKIKSQMLTTARLRVGAGKEQITITENEWQAIQAGAISHNKLTQIVKHSNLDELKKLATPRATIKMTDSKKARAQGLIDAGMPQAEIAQILGVSLSTLKASLRNE